jgi:DNA-binding CsgD family transcriptional regulator
LHRRLADLVPAREAVRHLAAAGEAELAYRTAVRAADAAAGTTDRAELLLLACDLAGHRAEETVRLAAASAALHAGRPGACLRVLEADVLTADPTAGPEHWPGRHGRAAAVLRAEALVQTGAPAAAVAAISAISDTEPADTEPADTGSADTGSAGGGSAGGDRAGGGWPADLLGARDRVLLLGALANGPDAAVAVLGPILARHGDTPAHAGLRAAIAAVRAATRQAGWEYGLASAAAAAGGADDVLAARWSAWLLVETLAADGRLAAAGVAATAAGHACAADLAYSWQTRFVAAALWYTALRGDQVADQTTDENPNGPNNGDTVVRRATDLTDRTVPAIARGYAAAAASLVEADSGLLASARSRLAAVGAQPAATAAVLDWVRREAAWLDGQPDLSTATVAVLSPGPPAGPAAAETDAASSTLIGGLLHITARWARYDTDAGHVPGSRLPSPNVGADVVGSELPGPDIRGRDTGDHGAGRPDPGDRGSDPHIGDPAHPARIPAVAATLRAWAAVDQPALFDGAGAAWHTVARREEIRCLLAHGLLDPEPTGAVPPLLRAERLAGDAGLVVLLGRVRRALRRHAIHRDTRGRRTTGEELTDRERDVLGLVAHGEPTRRIAARLGIARETVETHIRAGMRKLGARTRTEAAALALEELA